MKFCLILLLSLIPILYTCAADNYPKIQHIDVTHYAFTLTLSDNTDVLEGIARIHVSFRKEGIDSLRLDLVNKSDEWEGKGMDIISIQWTGRALEFNHANNEVFIALPHPSKADETLVIEVIYRGIPAGGLTIGPNKYNERTFFSDNWPNKARHWLPTVDHPYDKATCEFVVMAPFHYQVISNGLLVEESMVEGGQKLTHWRQSVPIATWLYVLGVARFAVQYVDTFEGKSIQTWVYHQDRDAGFYDFAVPTKDAMKFYSQYVGPYAYEKLANVQSNSVSGGMEAATAIFYDARAVTGQRTERWRNVIIHEVAHQWFGNAVTEYDWDDVWLSEGFATYFTLLFIEYAYGREIFVKGLKDSRDRVFAFYKNNPDYRIVHDNLTDMSKVTTTQTYQKGAWVLHMLRQMIGDRAFQEGIQNYYRKFFNKNANTLDFIREMELTSGMALENFFQQWLYQGGNIELKGNWKYDSRRNKVVLTLEQVQNIYRFNFPLEIAIYTSDSTSPRVEAIHVYEKRSRFEFDLPKRPERVEFDPGTKLLATWEVVGN